MRVVLFVAGFLFAAVGLAAAAAPAGFIDQLTPEQKRQFGLDKLTPQQLAALGGAVENYRATGEAVAAKKAAEQAAATAVADYKKREEPGIVARALEVFKRDQEDRMRERFTAKIPGPFRGWSGGTTFQLDNGQLWRQVGTDQYVVPTVDSPTVEIFRSGSGYYRLQLADGAWVTVKRLQ